MSRYLTPLFALFALIACGTPEVTPDEPSAGAADVAPLTVVGVEVTPIEAKTLNLSAGPVEVDREVVIQGTGFMGTAFGPFVHFGEIEAPAVRLIDEQTVWALVPSGVHGALQVHVTNPDNRVAQVDAVL